MEEYKCAQVPVIINIPTNTAKLKVIATVLNDDDSFAKAETTLNMEEIYEARVKGEEWEDENVTYVLSDEYRKEMGE